jgi:hypothetical protein
MHLIKRYTRSPLYRLNFAPWTFILLSTILGSCLLYTVLNAFVPFHPNCLKPCLVLAVALITGTLAVACLLYFLDALCDLLRFQTFTEPLKEYEQAYRLRSRLDDLKTRRREMMRNCGWAGAFLIGGLIMLRFTPTFAIGLALLPFCVLDLLGMAALYLGSRQVELQLQAMTISITLAYNPNLFKANDTSYPFIDELMTKNA